MSNIDTTNLKLIYVLKIGHNIDNVGLYELIFSNDPTKISIEEWGWDLIPASEHAIPPKKSFIDAVYTLKTNSFDFFCLHEAVDREYMHGYHTIHALAYEIDKQDPNDMVICDYEEMFENDIDDMPLLVFHYGTSFANIKKRLDERNVVLRNDEFIETSAIEI